MGVGSGYDLNATWTSSAPSTWNDSACDVMMLLNNDTNFPSGMKSSFVDRFWDRVTEVGGPGLRQILVVIKILSPNRLPHYSVFRCQVRVSVYTDGTEKAFVTFSATDSNKMSWLTASNIMDSSYTDLAVFPDAHSQFSLNG